MIFTLQLHLLYIYAHTLRFTLHLLQQSDIYFTSVTTCHLLNHPWPWSDIYLTVIPKQWDLLSKSDVYFTFVATSVIYILDHSMTFTWQLCSYSEIYFTSMATIIIY